MIILWLIYCPHYWAQLQSLPAQDLSLCRSRSEGRGSGAGHFPDSLQEIKRCCGSLLNFPPSQMSLRAWSWAGHCSAMCCAVSSAPLQCGQVAESRHPILWRYAANNSNWAIVMHRSLVQSHCQRWNLLTLLVSTLWILACGSLRYLSSAMLCGCRSTAAQAEMRSIGVEDCGNVVPLLASRSASVLPSRPTCPGIHCTLTRFNEPMVTRAIQMELHMVSVCRDGP